MKLREAPLAALLALSLVSAPTAAVAQDAGDSAAATSEGGGTALAWGLAAVFAVVMGILVFSGDDDETPVSP
jgi:hypothetical protein